MMTNADREAAVRQESGFRRGATAKSWLCLLVGTAVIGVLMTSKAGATPADFDASERSRAEFTHVLRPLEEFQRQPRVHVPEGAVRDQATFGFAGTNNLLYRGGSVMLSLTAYAIYWAPGAHTIPSGYQALVNRWFSDLGGTSFYNIVTQYYEGSPPAYLQNLTGLGGAWVDTVNPYPHAGSGSDPLLDSDIEAEVERAIAVNGWPNGGLNAAFFVFTAKGVESCADATDCTIGTAHPVYCAYHSAFFSGSSDIIIYANMPYAGTWSSGYPYSCGVVDPSPNGDPDADEEISLTSHELFEAVTDPLGDAWYDGAGNEIGDKCGYQYGAVSSDGRNVTLNGNPYIVQQEWSNAAGSCALSYGPVATPTITRTPTRVATRTPTRTPSPSATPTRTRVPTRTATATATRRPSGTPTRTVATPTPTPSVARVSLQTATPASGCCYRASTKACFANVPRWYCGLRGGAYVPGAACSSNGCVAPAP